MPTVDKVMMSFLEEYDIKGCSLALLNNNTIVYARGYGWADPEEREAFTPFTRSRIASVSKLFTAVAVLKLQESGKLRLTDKAFRLLNLRPLISSAEVDPRLYDITIQQLLEHTAGWDKAVSGEPTSNHFEIARAAGMPPPVDPTTIVRFVMSRPLDFIPGTRYSYSNIGYSVLGRVIEKISGLSYEKYVKSAVLEPAGIKEMQIGKSRTSLPREARYYDESNRLFTSVFAEDNMQKVPVPYGGICVESYDSHGGWVGSAVDLAQFLRALVKGRIISTKSLQSMVSYPQYVAPGTNEYYGLGCNVVRGEDGAIGFYHAGALEGSQALLYYRPDGVGFVLLFNKGRTDELFPWKVMPHLARAIQTDTIPTREVTFASR